MIGSCAKKIHQFVGEACGSAYPQIEAEDAETPEGAHKILLEAYEGADVDGVHVFWYINGKAYKDSLKKPSVAK